MDVIVTIKSSLVADYVMVYDFPQPGNASKPIAVSNNFVN